VLYNGDLLAMVAAAALAFAIVVARRSETDPFHTWAACVTSAGLITPVQDHFAHLGKGP
jgi:drug/metabolite transporter (DMT)-like permease